MCVCVCYAPMALQEEHTIIIAQPMRFYVHLLLACSVEK